MSDTGNAAGSTATGDAESRPVRLADRTWAAGLLWFRELSDEGARREGAELQRPCHARSGAQVGFAFRNCVNLPSLATALRGHVGRDHFVALVAVDDDVTVLIHVEKDGISSDGDRVFRNRERALEAFAEARSHGAVAYATPGLADDAADLDIAGLAPTAYVRRTGGLSWLARITPSAAAAVVAPMLLLVGAAWLFAEDILALLDPPQVAEEPPPEPIVQTTMSAPALLDGCRTALAAWPPALAGWERTALDCRARFAEEAVVSAVPDLRDRPVLFVRWRLAAAASPSLMRRLAQDRLAGWPWASVDGDGAWAAVPLPPVTVRHEGEPPEPLAFVAAVDRRLGPVVLRMQIQTESDWTVRAEIGRSLATLAPVLESLPQMELVGIAEAGTGWRIEGRLLQPEGMTESAYLARRKGATG